MDIWIPTGSYRTIILILLAQQWSVIYGEWNNKKSLYLFPLRSVSFSFIVSMDPGVSKYGQKNEECEEVGHNSCTRLDCDQHNARRNSLYISILKSDMVQD